MNLTLVIIAAVLLLLIALVAVGFFRRQWLAQQLFTFPFIGRRLQRRAIQELSSDPNKITSALPEDLPAAQRQALEKAFLQRSPEEIERLMEKAVSGKPLTSKDLQRPVGSANKSKKQLAARRKKNRQARQQRKRNRK